MTTATARRVKKQKLLPDRIRSEKLDAAETAFFREQLEKIKARTYDRKMPKLRAREFVPLEPDVDNTMELFTWRGYDMVGAAILASSYADNAPRADVFAKEESVRIFPILGAYGYNLQEIRRSNRHGVALDQKRATASKRGTEKEIDRILALGDSTAGLKGLLNLANALTFTVPNGAGGTQDWASKTPEEMLADMIGIVEYIIETTEEVEEPDTLILPRPQMTLARTKRFSDSSDRTVLDWFKALYPQIQVTSWRKCAAAGVGSSDRMVAYTRSPEYVAGIIPQEYEQLPVETRNYEFLINTHARIGGVYSPYPLSIAYGDGI